MSNKRRHDYSYTRKFMSDDAYNYILEQRRIERVYGNKSLESNMFALQNWDRTLEGRKLDKAEKVVMGSILVGGLLANFAPVIIPAAGGSALAGVSNVGAFKLFAGGLTAPGLMATAIIDKPIDKSELSYGWGFKPIPEDTTKPVWQRWIKKNLWREKRSEDELMREYIRYHDIKDDYQQMFDEIGRDDVRSNKYQDADWYDKWKANKKKSGKKRVKKLKTIDITGEEFIGSSSFKGDYFKDLGYLDIEYGISKLQEEYKPDLSRKKSGDEEDDSDSYKDDGRYGEHTGKKRNTHRPVEKEKTWQDKFNERMTKNNARRIERNKSSNYTLTDVAEYSAYYQKEIKENYRDYEMFKQQLQIQKEIAAVIERMRYITESNSMYKLTGSLGCKDTPEGLTGGTKVTEQELEDAKRDVLEAKYKILDSNNEIKQIASAVLDEVRGMMGDQKAFNETVNIRLSALEGE